MAWTLQGQHDRLEHLIAQACAEHVRPKLNIEGKV